MLNQGKRNVVTHPDSSDCAIPDHEPCGVRRRAAAGAARPEPVVRLV
eukprot:COSAG02_NODE_52100_length_310_cov_0.601896_1_plen_46_part_10